MNVSRYASLLAALAVLGLAACGPRISDTGYSGTWTRAGLNTETTLSIVPDGDSYRFRWGRDSTDDRLQVRCDWDGHCEETFDGEIKATFQMRAWVDEENGFLRVECRGARTAGDGPEEPMHYVDELHVVRDGTKLFSYMIESHEKKLSWRRLENGRLKGAARRVFTKVSDSVVDPPERHRNRG